MKKTCHVCGFRNPVGTQNCLMCSALLPPDTGLPAGALCCPAPGCVELAVPPPAKYCLLCGSELKPVSYELWEEKFLDPALERDFVAALQDPSELLREAAEMGLPPDEADGRLDKAFVRRAGVSRDMLRQWVREHVAPLGAARDDTDATRAEALAHAARLSIKRPHAELILRTLAPEPTPLKNTPAAPHPAPPAAPSPDRRAPARPPDPEIPKPAGSAAAAPTITLQTPRRIAPRKGRTTATAEPEGAGWALAAPPRTEELKAETASTRSDTTRPSRLRVALICGALALCAALVFNVWVASRRARTVAVPDRPQDEVSSNVSPTQADAVPLGVPAADATPAAEAVASPEVTPAADSSNSNTEPPGGEAAVLIVFTNADDITVWINGRRQGDVSKGRPASFRVTPGALSVSATAQGQEQYRQNLSVRAGEKRTLFLQLRPQATPTPPRELARQHLSEAQALFQRRSYQAALAHANDGLRLDPRNPELLRLRQTIESAIIVLNRPSSTPAPQPSPRAREYQEPVIVRQPPPPSPQPVARDFYETARMTRKFQPGYPLAARNMRISGEVLVEVSLDEQGRATNATAISGPQLLQRAAVEGAMRSGYRPARRNGQSVRSSLRVTFIFKL